MLCKRIIPCLDIKNGRVVKGVNFTKLIDAGNPVEIAKYYSDNGADEIVFLDINATHENREIILDLIKETSKQVFIPLTVGGGIRNIDDISKTLLAGADKISINSEAIKNPNLIFEASKKFGSQCIVVAVDAKRNENEDYEVFIHGGRVNTKKDVIKWCMEVERLGAGEILLTSIDKDGTKTGYDIELVAKVSNSVGIPVIASGGASSMKDFFDVFTEGSADAALAASLFHFNEINIFELKEFLVLKGIQIRFDR